MKNLLEELQRRNIVRVAVAYAVVSWILIQAASIILPTFNAPAWVLQVFVLFIILGFWLAMVLAWAYGDTGEPRAEGAAPAPVSQRHVITDAVLVALMVALVGFSLFSYFTRAPTVVVADGGPGPLASIAVLAFDDLSNDNSQAYFAEGISEEILNALAQVEDLQVAARTSSFAFQGTGVTVQEIGERLGVAYVLEGSVRLAGDNMRITAQLIDTATGFHAWSDTYNRQVSDIFAVQDEVTNLILRALNDEMGTSFDLVDYDQGTDNAAAYNAYLLGRHHMQQRNAEDMREAVDAYRQAIDLDPGYADAWAGLGRAYYLNYDAFTDEEVAEHMRPALVEAIALDPSNAISIATLGLYNLGNSTDVGADLERVVEGVVLIRHAYSLAPEDIEIRMSYVNALVTMQRFRDAYEVLTGILEDDPTFPPALNNLSNVYLGLGRIDLAYGMIRQGTVGMELSEETSGNMLGVAYFAAVVGDDATLANIRAQFDAQLDNPQIAADYTVLNAIVSAVRGDTGPVEDLIAGGILEQRLEESDSWNNDDVAVFYALAGDFETAVDYYRRAIDEGNTFNVLFLRQSGLPITDEFYDYPAYQELMATPEIRDLARLHEIARQQGQWEPLTDDEVGQLTN